MNKTILVIDDSESMRAVVRMALERASFVVVEAGDGLMARDMLDVTNPACVVCDVNMPRLDGISFVKHLKTTRHKFVPVVMLTTSTQESQKAECRAAGVRVWVTKPFQPSDLIRAVTTVCGAASASSI